MSSDIPIIVLSGRDEILDRLVGLEFGAEIYDTKPFEAREFLAPIRIVVRRARPDEKGVKRAATLQVRFGDWVLNVIERTLTATGAPEATPLTTTELDVLLAFVTNPHMGFSRDQLLGKARRRETNVGNRTINANVARSRRKIEPDPAVPAIIKTAHGIG